MFTDKARRPKPSDRCSGAPRPRARGGSLQGTISPLSQVAPKTSASAPLWLCTQEQSGRSATSSFQPHLVPRPLGTPNATIQGSKVSKRSGRRRARTKSARPRPGPHPRPPTADMGKTRRNSKVAGSAHLCAAIL